MQDFCAGDRSPYSSGSVCERYCFGHAASMLSIYSNFGEGFERDGNREFIQFLSISKGSVGEVRAQLLYALDLGYLGHERFEQLNVPPCAA